MEECLEFGKSPAYEQAGNRIYKGNLDGTWEISEIDLNGIVEISDIMHRLVEGDYLERFLCEADEQWREILKDSAGQRYNVYISRTFKYVCRRNYR